MKTSNLYFLITLAILFIIINSCANQGTPTGGPRDSIPPTVINSVPYNQAINFKSTQLQFQFDERITAEKLKQQLIITPNTELEYSFITKKDILIIKLQTPLEDSITYSFNFLEGVTDLTEKNPVVNFKLAFSTGPFIDSIYVTGQVTELLSGAPASQVTIALYDAKDTLTVFEDKPKYFIKASEEGQFSLENVKIGNYLLYAWNDTNKNLQLDTETEAYAFRKDTLDLTVSKDSIKLTTIGINTKEPDLLSARSAGRYFDVKYNKLLLEYKATPIDPNKTAANHLINGEKLIRFYNTANISDNDSIAYYIYVSDSLQQTRIDTVSVKFRATKKKPGTFQIDKKTTNNQLRKSLDLRLAFNKPIGNLQMDSILIAIDTLATIALKQFYKDEIDQLTQPDTLQIIQSIDSTSVTDQSAKDSDDINHSFTWNTNKTILDIQLPIDWKYINDSITKVNAHYLYLDSLSSDTTRAPYQPIKTNTFKLLIKKGALLSAESDTLESQAIDYIKEDQEELGMFILDINTAYQNFWIELINKETKEVERTVKITDQKQITFNRLKPADYKFIVKLDDNQDGKWSYGNILTNTEPETIIHTGLESALRANFEVSLKLDF